MHELIKWFEHTEKLHDVNSFEGLHETSKSMHDI
jgi:hypothetical protein